MRVDGREEMDEAVMQSQIFVRIRGLPGWWRDLKWSAREFWGDIFLRGNEVGRLESGCIWKKESVMKVD
jgi:hypothetical protein